MRLRWIIMPVLLCLAMMVSAQDNTALSKEILERSEFPDVLQELNGMIRQVVDDRREEMGASAVLVENTFLRAADPDVLFKVARDHMANNFDGLLALETLKFLKTPLFQRIKTFEERLDQLDDQSALITYGEQLQKRPPDPDLLSLVQRLDKATRSSESVINLMPTITYKVSEAWNLTRPQAERIPEIKLKEEKTGAITAMTPVMKNTITLMMLYAYEETPLDELETYCAFYESAAGKWLVNTSIAALDACLEAVSRRSNASLKDNPQ